MIKIMSLNLFQGLFELFLHQGYEQRSWTLFFPLDTETLLLTIGSCMAEGYIGAIGPYFGGVPNSLGPSN